MHTKHHMQIGRTKSISPANETSKPHRILAIGSGNTYHQHSHHQHWQTIENLSQQHPTIKPVHIVPIYATKTHKPMPHILPLTSSVRHPPSSISSIHSSTTFNSTQLNSTHHPTPPPSNKTLTNTNTILMTLSRTLPSPPNLIHTKYTHPYHTPI